MTSNSYDRIISDKIYALMEQFAECSNVQFLSFSEQDPPYVSEPIFYPDVLRNVGYGMFIGDHALKTDLTLTSVDDLAALAKERLYRLQFLCADLNRLAAPEILSDLISRARRSGRSTDHVKLSADFGEFLNKDNLAVEINLTVPFVYIDTYAEILAEHHATLRASCIAQTAVALAEDRETGNIAQAFMQTLAELVGGNVIGKVSVNKYPTILWASCEFDSSATANQAKKLVEVVTAMQPEEKQRAVSLSEQSKGTHFKIGLKSSSIEVLDKLKDCGPAIVDMINRWQEPLPECSRSVDAIGNQRHLPDGLRRLQQT